MHEYLDSEGLSTDDIIEYINVDREYLTRWNPINSSFNSEIIFDIPALSYAFVTIDLRHLYTQYSSFTYYEDWGISFTIGTDITEDSRAIPVQMPELFIREQTDKNQILEFQVFAWVDQKMRVDILLYNGLYFNLKNMFLNSATVEIKGPNRANFGKTHTFAAIIRDEYGIGLPINSPPYQQIDTEALPDYTITFADNDEYVIDYDTQNRVVTKRGKNIWVPASLYWQDRTAINLPYFPYFSNCKGYGQYIPIWAATEVNSD